MSASVQIYDPALFRKALELDDDGFLGPEDERPPLQRTIEEAVRARCLQKIIADPRGPTRPSLVGTVAMAERLVTAAAVMPNFALVTGLIERAIVQSSRTGRPVRFPPILMLSPPGVGKSFYCRQIVARSMATTCVPIAINGTSDRGQIGGLAPTWRGATIGKLAKGLLNGVTAAPLYLLDELDKCPALSPGEATLDVLLSALEPENARHFVDEYLDLPLRLDSALWLASANEVHPIPGPLLSRMVVVDVPLPTPAQAAITVRAIAVRVLEDGGLSEIDDDAVEALVDLSARRARQTLEIAAAFSACDARQVLSLRDVRQARALIERGTRRRPGFVGA